MFEFIPTSRATRRELYFYFQCQLRTIRTDLFYLDVWWRKSRKYAIKIKLSQFPDAGTSRENFQCENFRPHTQLLRATCRLSVSRASSLSRVRISTPGELIFQCHFHDTLFIFLKNFRHSCLPTLRASSR